MTIYIVLGLAIAVAIWGILVYNRIVGLRQRAQEAWSDIDTQLKRRHDIIPNLVETVKGYAAHERQVFQQVAEARTRALSARTVQEKGDAEANLAQTLQGLVAIAEAYPELKASENFLALQQSLSQLEDDIQKSRRYYNAVVRDHNIAIQIMPNSIVALLAGFHSLEFFQLEQETERAVPGVTLP